jgi:hypothetical protein
VDVETLLEPGADDGVTEAEAAIERLAVSPRALTAERVQFGDHELGGLDVGHPVEVGDLVEQAAVGLQVQISTAETPELELILERI